jgi:hypothetical protein
VHVTLLSRVPGSGVIDSGSYRVTNMIRRWRCLVRCLHLSLFPTSDTSRCLIQHSSPMQEFRVALIMLNCICQSKF